MPGQLGEREHLDHRVRMRFSEDRDDARSPFRHPLGSPDRHAEILRGVFPPRRSRVGPGGYGRSRQLAAMYTTRTMRMMITHVTIHQKTPPSDTP